MGGKGKQNQRRAKSSSLSLVLLGGQTSWLRLAQEEYAHTFWFAMQRFVLFAFCMLKLLGLSTSTPTPFGKHNKHILNIIFYLEGVAFHSLYEVLLAHLCATKTLQAT